MAVVEGGELVDWAVMGLRQCPLGSCSERFRLRLRELLLRYQPGVVAVEDPSAARRASSSGLGAMVAQARRAADGAGLVFQPYTPETIRTLLCGSASATVDDVAGRVVGRFPHLAPYRGPATAWKEAYWEPMFTAVAVALVCAGTT